MVLSNFLNLPTAFWGLLGPRKDVTVDFIKNHKQADGNISYPSGIIGMARSKRPQKVKCVSFLRKQ